ncbi:hypothetical protein N1F78_00935 [Seonamhaeicola sp. MEBiC1930]|uniref:hypothetical protein n=1 Tax=Seonamhaeicola sp. MEBiC01930 TaxID=2976768 RepID=UPI0032561430
MPIFHGVDISSDTLKAYETENLEYKTQAREIICEQLGYEPLFPLSSLAELRVRNALKRFELDEISKSSLDFQIQFQKNVVNSIMTEAAQLGQA